MRPAMFESAARQSFCDGYFAAVGAQRLVAKPDYREYQLPIDVDKELTDRPYYWLWVERTGEVVEPTVLRLAFAEGVAERESERMKAEAMKGPEWALLNDVQRMFFRPPAAEYVAFGSFRLEKIFDSVKTRGIVACVKQVTTNDAALAPWLLCQCLITYQCDLSSQRIVSLGVNLKTGMVCTDFLPRVQALEMLPIAPGDCVSDASWSLDKGLDKVMQYVNEQLSSESHSWADDARLRLEAEHAGIDLYYDSIAADVTDEERPLVESERKRKRIEHEQRIQPGIECQVTQMALIRCQL